VSLNEAVQRDEDDEDALGSVIGGARVLATVCFGTHLARRELGNHARGACAVEAVEREPRARWSEREATTALSLDRESQDCKDLASDTTELLLRVLHRSRVHVAVVAVGRVAASSSRTTTAARTAHRRAELLRHAAHTVAREG